MKKRKMSRTYLDKVMSNVKIEKGIPMPVMRRPTKYTVHIPEMEVGDSVFYKARKDEDTTPIQRTIAARYYAFCKRNDITKNWKFKTRKTSEGVRIWRVK